MFAYDNVEYLSKYILTDNIRNKKDKIYTYPFDILFRAS